MAVPKAKRQPIRPTMADSWPVPDDAQRLAWLRLIRTPRIGPATFRDLINRFGSAQAALDGLPEMTARRGRTIKPVDAGLAEKEMEDAARLGARFVIIGEDAYPPLLAKIDHPPPVLCVLAQAFDGSSRPAVGLVGSRNASAGGITLARQMAQELGEADYLVVSGLARGMDAAAHTGALKTGTIAFTAGGLARPYPPEHGELMRAIVEHGGAIYSEMPIDWTARAQDFPRRNRLVAGSGFGLIVVEAASKSGSLITANQATEMGRLVMAVPGFPLDPRSAGPNRLIRSGATLVRNAKDVLEELAPLLTSSAAPSSQDEPQLFGQTPYRLEEGEQGFDRDGIAQDVDERLAQAMTYSPVAADDLIAATGIPTGIVRAWLLENELADRLVRTRGDRFAWNPDIQSPSS